MCYRAYCKYCGATRPITSASQYSHPGASRQPPDTVIRRRVGASTGYVSAGGLTAKWLGFPYWGVFKMFYPLFGSIRPNLFLSKTLPLLEVIPRGHSLKLVKP